MPIQTRAYALSDVGRTRKSNQDSGYTGYNLFFVADGMGGHAGGDIASALVTQQLAQLDGHFIEAAAASKGLLSALWDANAMLAHTVKEHSELAGMGTTVSALIFAEDKVVVAHIGDSRVYLARNGVVRQITTDHTFVQRLVDTGRITPAEALVHPRRSVLMRVIGDVEQFPEIDIQVLDAQAGDRWMVCSDGLSGVVPEPIMDRILIANADTEEVCDLLVSEALEHGAPDNVTVAVIDVSEVKGKQVVPTAVPKFHGSAVNEVVLSKSKGRSILSLFNPMLLPELFGRGEETSSVVAESEEYLEKILRQTRVRIRNHRLRQIMLFLLLAALAATGLFGGYKYTQTRYYVGESSGKIAIYQGVKERLGPLGFSHLLKVTNTELSKLSQYESDLVTATVPADSVKDAWRIITSVRSASRND
jgi:serine/threonine protein phosphatase PrpC